MPTCRSTRRSREQARWLGLAARRRSSPLDGGLTDGDVLRAGAIALRCAPHAGPHARLDVLRARARRRRLLFTGDTLFRGAVGRWDLGGTSLADIVASIRRKLLVYDDASVVVPGHGPATTIGEERRANPYLA